MPQSEAKGDTEEPITKHSCAVQVTEPWHRLPRACGLSLETFRPQQDMGLGTLLWVSLLEQGLGQMDPEGPSYLKWFMHVFRTRIIKSLNAP